MNHPNIAAIHGVEEIDTCHFLVMELVPGETLADRIKRGAIPVEEALPIAKQIAEALEEAHEKAIIHRDLKPANIKVTPDGKVKVLDFGLAKAYAREQAEVSASNSPTLMSVAASNAGVILGTVAYTSPEQASGKTVDKRSDLWAFGVVLLEMLTGRPVFKGETVSHILASVLKDEPDWNALPANTPAPLRRLLRRCTEKDRKRRMDSAADARLEIEEGMMASNPVVAPVNAARTAASSRWMWIALSAALLAVALAFVHFREVPPAAPPEIRVEVNTPFTTDPFSFAISPDGRRLVFSATNAGKPQLWVRQLNSLAAQPLPGTDRAIYPFWSPDSTSIGFFSDGKLKRTDIIGGVPQVLANAINGRGGAWNREGTIVFTPAFDGPLFKLTAGGGQPEALTRLETGQKSHRFPQFLPDGRHFIYFVQGGSAQGVYAASLDGGSPKRLVSTDAAASISPSGLLLFLRQATLFAQALISRDKNFPAIPFPWLSR